MENKKFLDLEGLEHYHDKAQQKIASIYATNSQLNTTVNAEKSARESADSSLQSQISSLAAGSPIVVSSVSEMADQTCIYVNTTDGKWYYYDGAAWTAGGDYADGVTESVIEWYLGNIAEDGGNLFNPLTCKDNIALISATGEEFSNTNYWVSDYIEVNVIYAEAQSANPIPYVGNILNIKTLSPCVYKFVAYDENKNSLGKGTLYLNQYCLVGRSISNDVKYIRLQFQHSVIAYEDRDKIIFSLSLIPDRKNKTYYNVRETSIKDCGTSIFNEDISKSMCADLIRKGVMPFTVNDLANGSIQSSSGKYKFDNTRIIIDKTVLYSAGTRISLDGDWTMLGMSYTENGAYLGNYAPGWSSEINISNDAYLKLIFRKNNLTITGIDTFRSLLDSIHLSTSGSPNQYYGEKISLNNSFSVLATQIVGLHQDGASYGNIIIFCGSDGKYKVYNNDGTVAHSESYIAEYSQFIPHFNSVCFGTERFDSGDNYPLFYGNAYNNTSLPKGALYAYRLKNDFTTEYKQRIVVGFTEDAIWAGNGTNVRPYGNFVIDTDNDYLYAFTMIDSLNVTRFFKFNMPSLAQGSDVTLQQGDILEYFDVPYEAYIQGCCYHNGKVYSLSGFGSSSAPAKLHVISLASKSEVSEVPLGEMEPEAVYVNNGKLYIGQTTMSQYLFN